MKLVCLHWPSECQDLVFGGISYVKLLILSERCASERLVLEKSES